MAYETSLLRSVFKNVNSGKISSLINLFATRPLQIRTIACPDRERQDHSKIKIRTASQVLDILLFSKTF